MILEFYFSTAWIVSVILILFLVLQKSKKNVLKSISIFIITSLIAIPVYTSYVYAENRPPNVQGIPDIAFYQSSDQLNLNDYVYDPDNQKDDLVWTVSDGEKISLTIDSTNNAAFTISPTIDATEEFTFTATDPGGLYDTDTISVKSMRFKDGGKACNQQKQDSKLNSDYLGDEASALEHLVYIALALCVTLSTVHAIINFLDYIWPGSAEDVTHKCKILPWGEAVCAAIDRIHHVISNIWAPVKIICCFITCGWCSGHTHVSDGTPPTTGGETTPTGCPSSFGLIQKIPGMSEVSVDPFENIYTALACLCPVAVIFNLRKMKLAYQVYECCIEQACERGLETKGCDDFLKQAECMYLEGAMKKTVITILANIVFGYLYEHYIQEYVTGKLGPFMAVLKLYTLVKMVEHLMSIWSFATKEFDAPTGNDCKLKVDEYFGSSISSTGSSHIISFEGKGKEGNYDYYIVHDSSNSKFSFRKYEDGTLSMYDSEGQEVHTFNSQDQYISQDNRLRDAAWTMFSFALDNWVYNLEDKCKQETDSSRPQNAEPVSSIVSNSFASLKYCNNDNTTIFHAEGYTYGDSSTEEYRVDVTYSITACDPDLGTLNYGVGLRTADEPPFKYDITSGSIIYDQSESTALLDEHVTAYFTKVCIVTDDTSIGENGNRCFDLIEE